MVERVLMLLAFTHRMEDLLISALQLSPHVFDVTSLAALSLSTKNLYALARNTLQQNSTFAKSWLIDAVGLWKISGPPPTGTDWEPIGLDLFSDEEPESAMSKAIAKDEHIRAVQPCPILWLLANGTKVWGITQLAARLDLQAALLTAGDSCTAASLLISAGARITEQFILTAALTPVQGLTKWLHICKRWRIRLDLSPFMSSICFGEVLDWEQMSQLTPLECYTAIAVALSQGPGPIRTSPQEILLQPSRPGAQWTREELLQLLRVAVQTASGGVDFGFNPRWSYPPTLEFLFSPALVPVSATLAAAHIAELLDYAREGTVTHKDLLQQLQQKPLRSPRAVYHLCKTALRQWDADDGPAVGAWLHTPAARRLSGDEIADLIKLTFGWVYLEWDCSCYPVLRALLALPAAAELPAVAVAEVLQQVWHGGLGSQEGTMGLVRDLLRRCPRHVREEVVKGVDKTSLAMTSWVLQLVQEGMEVEG
jgi:hypothetical protein